MAQNLLQTFKKMREILFRAKAKNSIDRQDYVKENEWAYGAYAKIKTKVYGGEIEQHAIVIQDPVGNLAVQPVYENTVGQYTGFTDKNGNKIFEGDVMRSDYYPYSCIPETFPGEFKKTWDEEKDNYVLIADWSEKNGMFLGVIAKMKTANVRGGSHGIPVDFEQDCMKRFEIIGSIHDKELMEKIEEL
jgi:uncharacterized phage protein (TIGR01671 family)